MSSHSPPKSRLKELSGRKQVMLERFRKQWLHSGDVEEYGGNTKAGGQCVKAIAATVHCVGCLDTKQEQGHETGGSTKKPELFLELLKKQQSPCLYSSLSMLSHSCISPSMNSDSKEQANGIKSDSRHSIIRKTNVGTMRDRETNDDGPFSWAHIART
ncbi:hypothetical protein BO86DRAFT_235191 [Aspergillus japonicus CBS 114.51]|uniref:Uncharacterized protein n=1 Tax=Aspergillus japonicus CBS 114.51 TaxID=1448312 RepID=A0A8T8WMH9_ASPJA|nr:hypothetical protein BO86DRAFT_235191 [Aspergillus japonicus CBS 114.51]RAH76976.1 hypothetical protein BO86DRAFT_235191 [Aspergillus japonicus CBS 114.51]